MAEWDPRPGAAKAVKDARRERASAAAARKRVNLRWRSAKAGYAQTLREAVAVLDKHTEMTTVEIAKLLGVTQSTVSEIRHGRR